MSILKGKTIVITGGSRGIGLAIGLRYANEGANIVILAKDEPAQPSPSAIQTAADQMIAAGGKALPLNVDVRDAQAVESAIKEAVSTFGGIDILVNNVSAFSFADTINTSPEEFNLLFSVNVRATFLLSKLCVPYLKNGSNPHIINISPPLEMEARWFKHHLAFTMSKYGMSMCTLGMAEEFKKSGVAVNSLWPQTTIATSTIQDHFIDKVYKGSRWPSIMADAAYELVKRNARKCTGQFFIDEALLRENGVTDFSQYAVDPNATLVEDLFVPDQYAKQGTRVSLEQDLFSQKK